MAELHLQNVSDEELVHFYNKALALLFVSDWKDFIYRYSHDIERKPRYDAVFIIPLNKDYLTGIIVKLFNFAPDFAASRFIFTDIEMLKRDECFYGNEIYPLKDVFSLLEKRYLKQ